MEGDLLDRPIFVVGAQRSGTTLLRLMLDAHPDVAIGSETGFVRGIDAVVEPPEFPNGVGWYEEYGWSRERIERETARLYSTVFSDWARSMGALRWGEKTPLHRYHVPRLARWFPDAQFVGVVRHPCAVAASRHKWGYDWESTCRDWNATCRHLIQAASGLGPHRMMLVRYEDLTDEPEMTLGRILTFLGLTWSDHCLTFDVAPRADRHVAVTDGGTRTDRGLDPARTHAWATDATAEDLEVVRQVNGDWLGDFGYRLDPPWHAPPDDVTIDELRPRPPGAGGGTPTPEDRQDPAPVGPSNPATVSRLSAELADSRRAREHLLARLQAAHQAATHQQAEHLRTRIAELEQDVESAREAAERARQDALAATAALKEQRQAYQRLLQRRSVRLALRAARLLRR